MIAKRNPQKHLFVQENGRQYSHETFRRHLQSYSEKFGIYEEGGPPQLNFTYRSVRRFGVTHHMRSKIPPVYVTFMRGDKMKKSKDLREVYFDVDVEDAQHQYDQNVFKFWG
ncbi:MAG: hypothetical protein LBE57_00025 [Methanosarcinales archaeon]|jgi:hypothetical protein|nr:hypothetical protein [Methanosarcinales archaeon]